MTAVLDESDYIFCSFQSDACQTRYWPSHKQICKKRPTGERHEKASRLTLSSPVITAWIAAQRLISFYWFTGRMPPSDIAERGAQALEIFDQTTLKGDKYVIRESFSIYMCAVGSSRSFIIVALGDYLIRPHVDFYKPPQDEVHRSFDKKYKYLVVHEILASLDCYVDHSRLYSHVLFSVAAGQSTRDEGMAQIMQIIGTRMEDDYDGLPQGTDRTLT